MFVVKSNNVRIMIKKLIIPNNNNYNLNHRQHYRPQCSMFYNMFNHNYNNLNRTFVKRLCPSISGGNIRHYHHNNFNHSSSFRLIIRPPSDHQHRFQTRKHFTTFFERSVNEMTFRTCVGTYDKLKILRPNLYRDASSQGIFLTIKYFDSWKPVDPPYEQVVVAVHGSAGNFTHFYPMPEYFAKKNIRFVCPNLPDFTHTRKNNVFWHSSEERSQFLKDFLKKLGIKHIDCLIAHSMGIQTVSAFWDDPGDITINSIALFAPQPLLDATTRLTFSVAKSFLMFRSEWWYDLLSALYVHKLGLIPMRFNNINEFLGVCATGFDVESPRDLPERIEHLTKSFIPVVILYGSRESLVADHSIKKLRKYFEINDSDIVFIDPNFDEPDWVQLERKITYYRIKHGGHFVHANYSKFSIRMIENLLNYKY